MARNEVWHSRQALPSTDSCCPLTSAPVAGTRSLTRLIGRKRVARGVEQDDEAVGLVGLVRRACGGRSAVDHLGEAVVVAAVATVGEVRGGGGLARCRRMIVGGQVAHPGVVRAAVDARDGADHARHQLQQREPPAHRGRHQVLDAQPVPLGDLDLDHRPPVGREADAGDHGGHSGLGLLVRGHDRVVGDRIDDGDRAPVRAAGERARAAVGAGERARRPVHAVRPVRAVHAVHAVRSVRPAGHGERGPVRAADGRGAVVVVRQRAGRAVLARGAVVARATSGERGGDRHNEGNRSQPVRLVHRVSPHGRLSLLTSPPRSAVLS